MIDHLQDHKLLPLLLIVEDSKFDRLILKEAFKEFTANLSLRFLDHGEALLDYLHGRTVHGGDDPQPRPALILMDLNMPRMNGLETLRAIRADLQFRALPVIILSTSDNSMQVTQAYAQGVNAYMTKPNSFTALVELLRSFVGFWFGSCQHPHGAAPSSMAASTT